MNSSDACNRYCNGSSFSSNYSTNNIQCDTVASFLAPYYSSGTINPGDLAKFYQTLRPDYGQNVSGILSLSWFAYAITCNGNKTDEYFSSLKNTCREDLCRKMHWDGDPDVAGKGVCDRPVRRGGQELIHAQRCWRLMSFNTSRSLSTLFPSCYLDCLCGSFKSSDYLHLFSAFNAHWRQVSLISMMHRRFFILQFSLHITSSWTIAINPATPDGCPLTLSPSPRRYTQEQLPQRLRPDDTVFLDDCLQSFWYFYNLWWWH